MTRVAIIDTNVIAAGLMTAEAQSPTARITDGMLRAAFPFALSEALLAEYSLILNRPGLRKRHGLMESEIDAVLATVAEYAIVLTPARTTAAPDPGDQHLWNLLASRQDLCLVTGDKRLLEAADPPGPVVTPATFVAPSSARRPG